MSWHDRAQRLESARERLGLRKQDLAAIVGLTKQNYKNWLKGEALSGDKIEKIAKELGLNPSEIAFGETVVRDDGEKDLLELYRNLEPGQQEAVKGLLRANVNLPETKPASAAPVSSGLSLAEIGALVTLLDDLRDDIDNVPPDQIDSRIQPLFLRLQHVAAQLRREAGMGEVSEDTANPSSRESSAKGFDSQL